MASISMRGYGDAEDIAAQLTQGITESGASCELVDSVRHSAGGQTVIVLVFEKYYMRVANRASLTVVVGTESGAVTVDAIGSGGGQGALLRFSWGTEENFVNTVAQILEPLGFK